MPRPRCLFLFLLLLLSSFTLGCSIRRFAINKVADAIASGGSTYETDEDIELVGDALPFGLKLTESLLAETPRHKGLLLSACQGFTSYAYVYVQQEADVVAEKDLAGGNRLRTRARKLYLRAHEYCMRGLEVSYPGITEKLWADPKAVVSVIKEKDVPLLYWSAASLGLAISVSRNHASLLARLPEVEAITDRALRLNENWKDGTLHEFQVSFAGARPGNPDFGRIQNHFERALKLSQGKHAGLYVAYAEAFALPKQDRAAFRSLLEKALAINPDEYKEIRLVNLMSQRRAQWLLERIDDLILAPEVPAREEK